MKEIKTFNFYDGYPLVVKVADDGKNIIVGSTSNNIYIFDFIAGKEIVSFRDHTGWITSLAVSKDGRFLASGSKDKSVKIWNLSNVSKVKDIKIYNGGINSIEFIDDDKYIAVAGMDGTLRIIDSNDGKEAICFADFLDGEWAAISVYGFYNASTKGEKWINAKKGSNIVNISELKMSLYKPDFFKKIFDGQKIWENLAN